MKTLYNFTTTPEEMQHMRRLLSTRMEQGRLNTQRVEERLGLISNASEHPVGGREARPENKQRKQKAG